MGYLKGADSNAVFWGRVTKDATFRTFESGSRVANFSIAYERYEEDGKSKSKYIDVNAWASLADYAAGIERNDYVLVAGALRRDNYQSEKKGQEIYNLRADLVLVQERAYEQDVYDSPRQDPPPTPQQAPPPPPQQAPEVPPSVNNSARQSIPAYADIEDDPDFPF